jgi:hypothetical protein
MTDKPDSADPKVEGEGSYTATHEYKKSVDGFLQKKGADVDRLAREAEHALDSEEGETLRKAEEEARQRAKG